MTSLSLSGSDLRYAGIEFGNALSSTELEGGPVAGRSLTLCLPVGAATKELGDVRRELSEMRDREGLLSPKHMIFRKAKGGGYQTTWSAGVDLISRIVVPVTPMPLPVLCRIQMWNSDARYCPRGSVVVDLMMVSGSSCGLVLLSRKLLRQLGIKVPTSLRLIAPCDVCDGKEYIVLVENERLCLDCLHKDDVPAIDPPDHLVELLEQCGLETDVATRVILACNQDGYPIALVQILDDGSWMPCVVNLFPGSNGADLYEFVETGNPNGVLSGERAPSNTGLGALWKSCYGTVHDRLKRPF